MEKVFEGRRPRSSHRTAPANRRPVFWRSKTSVRPPLSTGPKPGEGSPRTISAASAWHARPRGSRAITRAEPPQSWIFREWLALIAGKAPDQASITPSRSPKWGTASWGAPQARWLPELKRSSRSDWGMRHFDEMAIRGRSRLHFCQRLSQMPEFPGRDDRCVYEGPAMQRASVVPVLPPPRDGRSRQPQLGRIGRTSPQRTDHGANPGGHGRDRVLRRGGSECLGQPR